VGNHSSAYNQNSFIARAMNADLDSKTLNGPYHRGLLQPLGAVGRVTEVFVRLTAGG